MRIAEVLASWGKSGIEYRRKLKMLKERFFVFAFCSRYVCFCIRQPLPTHHLTLLAHHPLTLGLTLPFCAWRRAQYSLNHPLSVPGAIFPQHINFLIYSTISIASTCSWNSLLLLRGSINIHRSICLSLQRGGRGGERGARIKSVPKIMTNVFQM